MNASEPTKRASPAPADPELARGRGDLLTFARRISHDLRTPLGGIITGAESLRELLAANGASSAPADAILTSADEISRLLKRVSFLARATASPRPKEPVAMTEIVAGVLLQLESRIVKRQAKITGPETWPVVNGVAAWIEVIWWNLLANALQHTGAAPHIELGWHVGPGELRFSVTDHGPGVPEARRGKLFQRFDTLHEFDSSGGLGLSIVQRLVELQGGHCGYETSPEGSNFFFALPAKGGDGDRAN